jgi:3-hydroxy acid dehydrogenase/malonic semialdehyde reductase
LKPENFKMKKILITGATSGFGKAAAERFAKEGHEVIITGRREERLNEIKSELIQKYNVSVQTLAFDVQDKEAVFASLSANPLIKDLDVLVNNAGLALGRDLFDEASLDDWETMIDTNVKGLLYVTKAVLPEFIKNKKGHIINIGSTAGKEVYERGNVYCATKHAVEALSQSMRIDLVRHGIKVTSIHPGAADTEFSLVRFKGSKEKADAVYAGYKPLYATDVADTIHHVTTLPEHVCLNSIVMTCTAQPNSFYLHRSTEQGRS